MKRIHFVLFFLLLTGVPLALQAQKPDKAQRKGLKSLEEKKNKYASVASRIWELAEVGYQEEQSSALLQETLKEDGFKLETGVAGMPTAFTATYGSGKPVIAILGEFDALPGVSQAAVPEKKPVEGKKAGHACGHHLFGTASAAAAIATKNWLQETGNQGTVRFYGTPAEEGGAGKVYMVRAGLFNDADAVLHWHPGSSNSASAASSLSNKSAKFRFYGNAAHAASAPEKGRSALDGVEAMNHMVNLLREHVPMETRIHYVITRGGTAPNIVPEFAEVFYYVRHPEMAQVKSIFERVVNAAEGAAQGTGTEMKYEVIHGLYNLLPNETLSRMMYENLQQVGGITYNEEEKAFAEKIRQTYDPGNTSLQTASEIMPFEVREKGTGGSTDVGDVSWMAPTAGLRTATWVPGTYAHSWQAVAAGGTSIGHKGMMTAAKTLFLTATDLFKEPEVTEKARQELEKRRGDNFSYEALLGDREPPLDYRK
jgi:aminobenzoyl-glutamate utilization protein B